VYDVFSNAEFPKASREH